MVSRIDQNYINAYAIIKENIPHELKNKLECKRLFNNDICKIARSVLVKYEQNGSISIKVFNRGRDTKISSEEIALIRKICSIDFRQLSEVQIARKGKIKKVDDIFSKKSETPSGLLGIIAEYIEETSTVIIDFVKNKTPIPQYLKDNLSYLNFKPTLLPIDRFKSIINEFKSLKSIKLHISADDSCLEALKVFPKLECLDICGNKKITNAGIDSAILYFNKLKYLDLRKTEITDEGLANISLLASSLQALILSTSNIFGKFLLNVNKDFNVLKKFELFNTKKIPESDLARTTSKLPSIKELKIFDIENIKHLLHGAKKLESLEIHNARDGCLKFVADECLNLKKLSIVECDNVSELGVNKIFSSCSELRTLQIIKSGRLNYLWFDSISEKPIKLTELTLNGYNDLTDKMIKSISKGCPDLKSFSLLFCHNVTDAGILHLVQGVKALQELTLAWNNNISPSSFDYILKYRESLRKLKIEHCKKLNSNNALLHLSQGLPSLKSLDLSRSNNLTDEGVCFFADWFPNLESLNLNSTSITDESLQYLKKIPKLSDLNLNFCRLTDEAIDQLFDFPSLARIQLLGCWSIKSKDGLNKFYDKGIEVIFF